MHATSRPVPRESEYTLTFGTWSSFCEVQSFQFSHRSADPFAAKLADCNADREALKAISCNPWAASSTPKSGANAGAPTHACFCARLSHPDSCLAYVCFRPIADVAAPSLFQSQSPRLETMAALNSPTARPRSVAASARPRSKSGRVRLRTPQPVRSEDNTLASFYRLSACVPTGFSQVFPDSPGPN